MEELSVAGAQPEHEEKSPVGGHGAGQPKEMVLIVEDDDHIAELLGYSFAKRGFATLRAADGLAACSRVEREKPAAVLLDLMLPGLDGREVCRLIRNHADRKLATTPIIMLTALSSSQDIARGMELGADLYITKPYSVREVVHAVEQLLSAREGR